MDKSKGKSSMGAAYLRLIRGLHNKYGPKPPVADGEPLPKGYQVVKHHIAAVIGKAGKLYSDLDKIKADNKGKVVDGRWVAGVLVHYAIDGTGSLSSQHYTFYHESVLIMACVRLVLLPTQLGGFGLNIKSYSALLPGVDRDDEREVWKALVRMELLQDSVFQGQVEADVTGFDGNKVTKGKAGQEKDAKNTVSQGLVKSRPADSKAASTPNKQVEVKPDSLSSVEGILGEEDVPDWPDDNIPINKLPVSAPQSFIVKGAPKQS